MIFFTADLHFGHAKVIEYSHRPFGSVEEMDEALVANWNDRVRRGDLVYVLGDFFLGRPPARAVELAERLNGNKFLVWGNHDKQLRKNDKFRRLWLWQRDLTEITAKDETSPTGVRRIVLCHYAMLTWNQRHRGAWQLHGHSHGSLFNDPHARRLDVGVDAWNYRPVSFEEVRTEMAAKDSQPVDHHEEKMLTPRPTRG